MLMLQNFKKILIIILLYVTVFLYQLSLLICFVLQKIIFRIYYSILLLLDMWLFLVRRRSIYIKIILFFILFLLLYLVMSDYIYTLFDIKGLLNPPIIYNNMDNNLNNYFLRTIDESHRSSRVFPSEGFIYTGTMEVILEKNSKPKSLDYMFMDLGTGKNKPVLEHYWVRFFDPENEYTASCLLSILDDKLRVYIVANENIEYNKKLFTSGLDFLLKECFGKTITVERFYLRSDNELVKVCDKYIYLSDGFGGRTWPIPNDLWKPEEHIFTIKLSSVRN